MSLPSTVEELNQLIADANAALYAILEAEAAEEERARAILETAGGILESLLGSVDTEPSTDSIRGVLAFGDAAIIENSAIATPLIVHGMETLTSTMIEVVKVLKTTKK